MSSATGGKRALITGVTGQDGAYLSRLLLDEGYEVHGLKRRSSSFNTGRIEDIYQDPHEEHQRFVLHYGDLTDSTKDLHPVADRPIHFAVAEDVIGAGVKWFAASSPGGPGTSRSRGGAGGRRRACRSAGKGSH